VRGKKLSVTPPEHMGTRLLREFKEGRGNKHYFELATEQYAELCKGYGVTPDPQVMALPKGFK